MHRPADDDLPARDQARDTGRGGRTGQPDGAGDFAVGQSAVDLEQFHDGLIDLIHVRLSGISRRFFHQLQQAFESLSAPLQSIMSGFARSDQQIVTMSATLTIELLAACQRPL
jgi:hypothetical protein